MAQPKKCLRVTRARIQIQICQMPNPLWSPLDHAALLQAPDKENDMEGGN